MAVFDIFGTYTLHACRFHVKKWLYRVFESIGWLTTFMKEKARKNDYIRNFSAVKTWRKCALTYQKCQNEEFLTTLQKKCIFLEFSWSKVIRMQTFTNLKTFCHFCEVFFSKDLVLAFTFLIFKYTNWDLLIKHESAMK